MCSTAYNHFVEYTKQQKQAVNERKIIYCDCDVNLAKIIHFTVFILTGGRAFPFPYVEMNQLRKRSVWFSF